MGKDNILVTNSNNEVVFAGDRILKYANLANKEPLGYPEGKAERGDILVCVIRDLQMFAEDAESLVKAGLCREADLEAESILLVGCIKNQEVKPLIKGTLNWDPENESVFLDTIYERNEIRIRRMGSALWFYLNGQMLHWNFTSAGCAAVLIKDREVKFFRCDGEPGQLLQPLLQEQKYPAYLYSELVCGQPVKKFLQKKIYDELMQMTEEEAEKSFAYRGTGVNVKKIRACLGEMEFNTYIFNDAENLMEELAEKSQKYKLLTAGNLEGMVQEPHFNSFRFWGNEAVIQKMGNLLQKCSVTNTTVLLTGESGTGKTFLAREIHRNSRRSTAPFVHVNCAAIPYQLIESELFGYEEGAFTGARKGGKKGYFELAYGGTLFLDEIAEIPLALQGKLLEVLQSKTFYQVGGTRKIETDVRLIAATNKNLKEMVREKRFREDLYYRINVFPIEIPPLRERRESLYGIIMDILPDICSRLEIEPVLVSSQAFGKMVQYPWPGNIRELENILEKAAILSDGKIILPEDVMLSETEPFTAVPVTLQEVRERAERDAIENALQMFHGDKNKAARYLDIGRSNMFEKVKRYRIQTKELEEDDFR